MTQRQFIEKTKTWVNHKIILSNKSNWYKSTFNKSSMHHVKSIFTPILNNTNVCQLAIIIKRNESLLEAVLPIPNNPSYENSLLLLKQIIQEAENIIKTYNLIV